MTAQPVLVGYNGLVPAPEAARYLGCSYSHMINLIKAKKLRAQKKENKWLVEQDDLQKAKSMHMVKPRPMKTAQPADKALFRSPIATDAPATDIKLSIPREKFEIIKLAFRKKDQSLMQYLNKHLDEIYEKVISQLESIDL